MTSQSITDEKITFSFGKNWEEFFESNFSEERILITQNHLLEFLGMPNLRDKYFLDIGCGSGLHSLAALRAGANSIVGVDVDPASVRTSERIRESENSNKPWAIHHGSILDKDFCAEIEPADIVYAWGSLHHTGQMWTAIENAAELIKDNGLFYIAIYTTVPKSEYWLARKIKYNKASSIMKKFMEIRHVARYLVIPNLLKRKNPIYTIRNYKNKRGMSYYTDVKDWLGGYPYEYASIQEILKFGREKLGLELINISAGSDGANTEYLFKRA